MSDPLWKNRDFNVFWLGQSLSNLGDSLSMVAAPLLVLEATGSIRSMGALTATVGLGNLIAGLASGMLVDRRDRRQLMIFCDLVRTALFVLVPLWFWWVGPSLTLLFAMMFLGSLLGNTFQVASITAVANLVERDQITEANGRLHASFAAMYCVGPMLAGFICKRYGATVALALDGLTFLISAASLMRVRLKQGPRAQQAEGLRELKEAVLAGGTFLFQHPVLRVVTAVLFGVTLFQGARNDLLIYHLKHTQGRTEDAVGVIFGLSALGAVAGGILASRLRRRFGFAAVWVTAGVLQGVMLASLSVPTSLWAMLPLAMGMTLADALRGINSMSLRQQVTPDPLLGRVTAAFWTTLNLPQPVGAAISTGLAQSAGTGAAMAICGVATAAFSLMALPTPLRKQR
jgi:Na+/melibiose symporter-like transporter